MNIFLKSIQFTVKIQFTTYSSIKKMDVWSFD